MQAEHYQRKKEQVLERTKRYYQENKQTIQEHKKQYQEKNRPKIKEKSHEYSQLRIVCPLCGNETAKKNLSRHQSNKIRQSNISAGKHYFGILIVRGKLFNSIF